MNKWKKEKRFNVKGLDIKHSCSCYGVMVDPLRCINFTTSLQITHLRVLPSHVPGKHLEWHVTMGGLQLMDQLDLQLGQLGFPEETIPFGGEADVLVGVRQESGL